MPHTEVELHNEYLKVSSAFNGHQTMTTEVALRKLYHIIRNTGPLNPLHSKAVTLREEIIRMDLPKAINSPKRLKTTATILAFPSKP